MPIAVITTAMSEVILLNTVLFVSPQSMLYFSSSMLGPYIILQSTPRTVSIDMLKYLQKYRSESEGISFQEQTSFWTKLMVVAATS
jgi:hypothetical protein